jgi:hypothetical protein
MDRHPLKKELEIKIKSFLVPALKQLIGYDKGMMLNVLDDLDWSHFMKHSRASHGMSVSPKSMLMILFT